MDALHCKKTPDKIVATGNHHAVKVKGNQPKLKEALEETIINTQLVGYHIEEEIIRSRCEIRGTWIYRREDNLADGLESIKRHCFSARNVLSPRKNTKPTLFMHLI
jgi:hypothetical protein